jgi:hypothetical protein
MKDEINRSIYNRDFERQSYVDAKNKLDNECNLKKAELEKECDFESEKLRILNLLPNVHKYAEELHDYLDKRFFVTCWLMIS